MKHIMLDVETLGTAADAVILSIGAVRFDLDSDKIGDEGFYASVSVESNLDWKRRVQEDTLIWWMKQAPAAQTVFHEAKTPLDVALSDFSDWMADTPDAYVWSMGADFDLPMIAHAFRSMSMEVPWKFWNSRCARTYKTLPQAAKVKIARAGTHHNALDDAVYQAQLVQAIQAELRGKVKA